MTPQAGPSGGARVPGGFPGDGDAARRPAPEPVGDGPDTTGAAPSTDDNQPEDDDQLAEARRERDEYLDALRRVQADFENYKKRMVRQQTDHLERAAEDLVTKLLPVLDALDLARAHLGPGDDLSPEGKALVAGSALLTDTLAREGLERIADAGDPFDPTVHEAVDHVPIDADTDATDAPGAGAAAGEGASAGPVVDDVLRAGYRWKGRVIRPAMVRVRG